MVLGGFTGYRHQKKSGVSNSVTAGGLQINPAALVNHLAISSMSEHAYPMPSQFLPCLSTQSHMQDCFPKKKCKNADSGSTGDSCEC